MSLVVKVHLQVAHFAKAGPRVFGQEDVRQLWLGAEPVVRHHCDLVVL